MAEEVAVLVPAGAVGRRGAPGLVRAFLEVGDKGVAPGGRQLNTVYTAKELADGFPGPGAELRQIKILQARHVNARCDPGGSVVFVVSEPLKRLVGDGLSGLAAEAIVNDYVTMLNKVLNIFVGQNWFCD